MEGSMHYFKVGAYAMIQLDSPAKNWGSLALYDQLGKQVCPNKKLNLQAGMNQISIDTQNLKQGEYIVKITTPELHFSRKITKL